MNSDQIFDEAVGAVTGEPIDPATERAAIERVARRLEADAAGTGDEHRIHGCEGFRALLPAHRAGALAGPKRLLLEDHLRECVPCRRALRELGAPATAPLPVAANRTWGVGARRALLAAGLAGVVLAGAGLWWVSGGAVAAPTAAVRTLEGVLLALDGDEARPLAAGATIAEARTVRTAAGSRAVLELEDGSRVELAPRSELTLGRRRDGVVLELGRGSLIVEAAEQKRGHLYVSTDDCLVAVVGTIFSVNHGARGSRVSVLDGEVRVEHGAELAVLRPGDQVATSERLDRVPIERDIAWSRNAPAYRERIAALAELGRELDRLLAAPEARTSTRLLDLVPADTAIYAALPNLAEPLSDAWATLERRLAEDPTLADWWNERFGDGEAGRELTAAIEELRRFGGRLGPELVVALAIDDRGHPGVPVVLAEVADRRGFEALVDEEIARLGAASSDHPTIRRVVDLERDLERDPERAVAGSHELLVWVAPDGLLVASTSGERLAAVAASLEAGGRSGFVGSSLHRRLAAVYGEGAEWLLAVDAGRVLASGTDSGAERAALETLGFADLEHVVVESRDGEDGSLNRARFSFRGERHGVASWLAAPAPSGALEFVSAEAQFAVAGLVKAPAEMVDDLLALVDGEGGDGLERLARAEAELGLSLRDDLAAALGGDFAIAIDGPWLPTPSWKVVVEVVDPARLDGAIGRLVEAANREFANREAADQEESRRPELVWSQELAGGRIFRRMATADGKVLFEATAVDGYLIVAPSRGLLSQTLARRAAGATLLASSALLERMPRDAEPDFSALVWRNLGDSAGDLGRLLAGVAGAGESGGDAVAELTPAEPLLALAYAGGDEIRLLAVGGRGPLGLSFESLLKLGETLRAARSEHEPAEHETAAPRSETRARPAA